MVRWRANLQTSHYARRVSTVLHLLALLLLILAGLSLNYLSCKIVAGLLIGSEWWRNQRKLSTLHGLLERQEENLWYFQQQRWRLIRRPWITPYAIWLALRNQQGVTLRFWVMRDSISEYQWRTLRQILFIKPMDP